VNVSVRRKADHTDWLSSAFIAIFSPMTNEQVKKVLDRVLTWPPERQADLAHIVELMEEQDISPAAAER
jgi:hypothetical protein